MTESVFDRITEAYGSQLEELTVVEKLEILGFIAESLIHKEKHPELTIKECFEETNYEGSNSHSVDALEVIGMLLYASSRELLSFSHAIVSQLSQSIQ